MVRRVSVEKDVRREEIVIEEKVKKQHNGPTPEMTVVGQKSESAESAAKVYIHDVGRKGWIYMF